MKILLDTHVLLWALSDSPDLSGIARAMIEDDRNEIFYSIISLWEVELKRMAHPDRMKLTGEELASYCEEAGYIRADLRKEHVFGLKNLKRKDGEPPHKDPFDRMLLSQSQVENMSFLTHDRGVAGYTGDYIVMV